MGIFLSLLYVLSFHWGIIKFWWSGATLDQVFKDALEILTFLFGIIIGLGLAVLFVYILSIKPEWNDEIINNWAEWPLRFNESTTGSQSSTGNSQKPGQTPGSTGQQENQNLNGTGAIGQKQ
ncbi:hypothetical protein KQX54_008295 [Cotesia glomerata]|uniref:Uncharacterized protein n=1 Tax=Cotesia glomerata TaxID=32391 RepID=A0AAV7III9_COTGL|nr:hypothetical protein KQX54_008295 [Cotesia glomerata]